MFLLVLMSTICFVCGNIYIYKYSVCMYVCIPHDFPTGGTDFVPTGRLPRSAREIKGDELTLGVSCENKYRCDDIIKNKHQVFLLCFLA